MTVGSYRRRWVVFCIPLLAVLGMVLGYVALRSPVASEKPAARSVRTDRGNPVKQAITALGRLEPRGGVIRVAAGGDLNLGPAIVRELRIKEGDRVEAGQILAILDSHARLEAVVREAEAKLRAVKTRLAEAKARLEAGEIAAQEAEVNRMQAEYDFAAAQYRRHKELFQARFISSADLEVRRVAMESQAQKLQQAKGVLRHLTVVRTMEMRSAEAARDLAAAALARAEVDWQQTSIRSPLAGHVIEVFARAGESADGRGIAAIGVPGGVAGGAEEHRLHFPGPSSAAPADRA